MLRVDTKNPLPLYLQVAEDIRRQITTGELAPGHRLLLEDALAEQYRVSGVTIKHALRNLAEEGLLLRIKRKGTFVSPRRDQPANVIQKTKTLALIIPAIEDLFISEIYRGVADVARQSDYSISIASSDREVEREVENITNLGRRGEAGAIIFPNWGRANAEQIFELKRRQFPFVMINRFFRDIRTHSVVSDNVDGACQAVEHLIGLGHRRIGCIGWVECTAIDDRLDGYRMALGRNGIAYREELVSGIMDGSPDRYVGVEPVDGGYEEMKRLLRLDDRPTAVFAVTDRLAVGAMRAVAEAGLTIPDDIALVGFDDIKYAADLDLTTVFQPAFDTGKIAAEILIREIEKNAAGAEIEFRKIVLPTKLVVRGTCGARKR